jgi:pilus assembly protein CpaE
VAANTRIHVVVVTVPERLDQEWINRLAAEPEIARVDRVAATTAGFELIQQTRPDFVIVDRDTDQTEQLIRQVFTTLPATICIAVTARVDTTTLRRLVAVGARDVLGRPIQYAELSQSIRTLLETETDRRSRALVTLDGNRPQVRGKLVVVISPKGGSGTTTIATNLAVGLRQVSASRVLLADCCLQFGDAGVQLNLWSKHTLVDLIDHLDDIDDAMIRFGRPAARFRHACVAGAQHARCGWRYWRRTDQSPDRCVARTVQLCRRRYLVVPRRYHCNPGQQSR